MHNNVFSYLKHILMNEDWTGWQVVFFPSYLYLLFSMQTFCFFFPYLSYVLLQVQPNSSSALVHASSLGLHGWHHLYYLLPQYRDLQLPQIATRYCVQLYFVISHSLTYLSTQRKNLLNTIKSFFQMQGTLLLCIIVILHYCCLLLLWIDLSRFQTSSKGFSYTFL